MVQNYQHLGLDERIHIQFLLERSFTVRAIARSLNRAPSTISRELGRNGWVKPTRSRARGRPAIAGCYRAAQAQRRADTEVQRARRPSRLRAGTWLWKRTCLNFCVRGGFHAVTRVNRSPYMTANWFIATFQS
jgi:IS30 family transposase